MIEIRPADRSASSGAERRAAMARCHSMLYTRTYQTTPDGSDLPGTHVSLVSR